MVKKFSFSRKTKKTKKTKKRKSLRKNRRISKLKFRLYGSKKFIKYV